MHKFHVIRFYEEVLIYSIYPKARGVAWHLTGSQLNLSIMLNRSLMNKYMLIWLIIKENH